MRVFYRLVFFCCSTARRIVETLAYQSSLALLTPVFAIAWLSPKEQHNDPFTGTTHFNVFNACVCDLKLGLIVSMLALLASLLGLPRLQQVLAAVTHLILLPVPQRRHPMMSVSTRAS